MARATDADALYNLVERRYQVSSGIEHRCERDLLDLICNMPTLTPPNEWVSVENAVPDPGERVLATDGTFVGEAYRTSANTWYRHTGFPWRDCLQSIVTLWMPLPTADKDNHVPAKAPNEPLTLEQLREMDGEPVWVEDVKHWALIDIEKGGQWDDVPFAIWAENGMKFTYNIKNRGLHCYRRPPEGEA
ncbi:hypothetical protein [Anaerotignum lactatifermentans]|uniref:hypothetical protein n=1 Tax=Anaerotignum lactatifermentans TaxID=160404 RepID=UPI003AB762D7